MGERLRVDEHCEIDLDELDWTFRASGGPGGQHANRSNTRAELTFDVAGSPSLTDWQRRRIIDKIGEVVRVSVDDERSQLRNRQLAVERLGRRIADAFRVERPRRPTKPSAGARRRRLDAKKRRGDTKRGRSWRPGQD